MPTKGIGRLFQAGVAKEAVRGTAEAAADYWIPFSELSIEERDEKIADEQSIGVIEDSIAMSIVRQWVEANLSAPIADKHFPLILLAALGSLSSAANADASGLVYDHTISAQQGAQHQSLTLFLDDPLAGQDYKHALGCLASLEINYELGKFLDYAAVFRAKKGATASLTPSTTSENRFLPQHFVFKLADDLAGLDGASAISIKNLKLTIEKNLEDDNVLGSLSPNDYLNKQLAVSGEFELLWDAETYKTLVLAGTSKAMRIDLDNTDVTIGNAEHPRVKIDLAKVTLTEISRPISLNDLVAQTIGFKAHYDTGESKMIEALVTNLVASY